MMYGVDDELPWPDDAVEVGRIVEPWGIKGWLRVQPHAKDPQALFSSRRWFLRLPEDVVRPPGAPTLPGMLRITQAKPHADGVVAAAQGVADRNAAELLKGLRIFVSRASFPTPAEDEYYWVDLIGMEVINREGVHLGIVTDMLDTGANSVLCVRAPTPAGAQPAPALPASAPEPAPGRRPGRAKPKAAEHERLIPFVAAHVDEVKLAQRRILVDWDPDF